MADFKEPIQQKLVDGVTPSQLLEVTGLNEKLNIEVHQLRKEKEVLLEQTRNLKKDLEKNYGSMDPKIDIGRLLEIINTIEAIEPQNAFSNSISINKNVLTEITRKMKNCIGDVCQSS